MKRKLILTVLAIIGLLSVFGFSQSPNNGTDHTLNLKTGSYKHAEYMKQGWQRVFGISSEADVSLVANLRTTMKKEGDGKQHQVSGTIVVKTPARAFPIQLGADEMLYSVKLPDGRTIFWGPLRGTMVGENGEKTQVTVGVTYSPDSKESLVTVSAGYIGNEAELVFGQPFVTKEVHDFMEAQIQIKH